MDETADMEHGTVDIDHDAFTGFRREAVLLFRPRQPATHGPSSLVSPITDKGVGQRPIVERINKIAKGWVSPLSNIPIPLQGRINVPFTRSSIHSFWSQIV